MANIDTLFEISNKIFLFLILLFGAFRTEYNNILIYIKLLSYEAIYI